MYREAIVVDNGSESCRFGLSGDEIPRISIPLSSDNPNRTEAFSKTSNDVISRGIITEWDTMEKIWSDTFSEKLQVDTKEHPILMTESAISEKSNRTKMTQIMFEKFSTPAMFLATPAVLSLYACGRTTGVVVDIGHGVSHTVPIYQGYALPKAAHHSPCAGMDLTNYLISLLRERGHILTTPDDRKVVHSMKEQFCRIALNFEEELKGPKTENKHTLPDGTVITMTDECIRCPEALFKTYLIDSTAQGIHEAVFSSIMACDMDIRRDLFANIILTGGSTLFDGFVPRLQKELDKLSPRNVQVKIKAPDDRKNTVWVGGSILTSLSLFEQMWVTRKEYEEMGPSVVHAKCYC
ncbi:actin-3-like isoform X1 [Ctenocephalides felis]|uniref:actin-3-like isoform X1 n=2 Tax=Ctenocephalides felis TaxID=7515 RepID=UPI000E6E3A99|nr:actin-3-like isoform X1 [Ctenocephalides felis]XP_026478013.1 actin-3-like isoform X1 [Ctenocephalides felis]XP_026478014.1 actin-3-like isoform X1 [Ctenocephalides felis]XP_026478015.1 actin-3-like isoform X1 [Ctenocephalides felis]XP_026478016.1 actin-3-like isoform X1 [Ctenocephalides felis]XP_026478017.1 actin-3-like isoform X1 [Ctenocephalides felis]XP_026478018.1 actin-3-like isoform X1 [Ctenocephalides felis]